MSTAPIVQELWRETAILKRILSKNNRCRVYRHHVFFRKATRASLETQRACDALTQPPTANSSASLKTGSSMGKRRLSRSARMTARAHRLCCAAAEAATEEVAAARIDTVAPAFAVLASLSRVGCLLVQTLVRLVGEAWCYRQWGVTHVKAALRVGCQRLRSSDQVKAKRRRKELDTETGSDNQPPFAQHQHCSLSQVGNSLGAMLNTFTSA